MSDDVVDVNIFSRESTVSQSASGIVRLLILQRFDIMLRDWRNLMDAPLGTSHISRLQRVCRSSVWSLVALLKPRWKAAKIVKFNEGLIYGYADTDDELREVIDLVCNYLENDLKLTKIDTRQDFDRTIIPNSNKHHKYT